MPRERRAGKRETPAPCPLPLRGRGSSTTPSLQGGEGLPSTLSPLGRGQGEGLATCGRAARTPGGRGGPPRGRCGRRERGPAPRRRRGRPGRAGGATGGRKP